MIEKQDKIIAQTEKWIKEVVIGLNFCPFAQKTFNNKGIRYVVEPSQQIDVCLNTLLRECEVLDEQPQVETTLVIFPATFSSFYHYLDLLELAENLIENENYTGIYQLASFHPQYMFEGSQPNDPANFTNRSPYPMLHLLREEQLERVLQHYPSPENIPKQNIELAKKKGFASLKKLWENCF